MTGFIACSRLFRAERTISGLVQLLWLCFAEAKSNHDHVSKAMNAAELDCLDIRNTLKGDDEAFARLIQRYENRIMRQMWRFARDPHTAEELVQDVFLEAYSSLKTFRGDAPFLHWLGRIASRVGYRYWKSQAKLVPHVPLADWDGAEGVDSSDNHERAAEWVHELLSRLDTDERLILTLHYFEDCSMREIAERMDWNRDMVKMRAYRARQKIKEMIERDGIKEELQWIL